MRDYSVNDLVDMPGVFGFNPAVDAVESGEQFGLALFGDQTANLVVLFKQAAPWAKAAGDFFIDGAVDAGGDFLVKHGDFEAGLADNLAANGFEVAIHNGHKGGFAFAVTADEADALAGFDLKADAVQYLRLAEIHTDITQAQQGHEINFHSKRTKNRFEKQFAQITHNAPLWVVNFRVKCRNLRVYPDFYGLHSRSISMAI